MSLAATLLLVATVAADPCAPDGRAALADEFATAIRRAQGLGAEDVRYEAEEFRLLVKRGQVACTINLRNLAAEYCAVPRAERSRELARLVRAAAESCPEGRGLPERYAEARPQLLPVVRSRMFAEAGEAMMAGADRLAGAALGEHLFVAVVWDTPETMRYVTANDLARWEVSWRTAYADALANLRQRSEEPFVEVAPGTWAGPWADAYAPSRLLLTEKLRGLVTKGDVVATIPNQNAIFVCGSEDAAALARLAALTEEASQKPHPVSALAILVSKTGAGDVFAPPASHAAHRPMNRLRLMELGSLYAEDKKRLEAQLRAAGKDVFVASYRVVESRSGELTSIGVLTVGVHTLFPRTDVVVFVDLAKGGTPVASASFEDALRALGPRAARQPGYPPRWEVKELPPAAELAKLGRLADF